jgi:hypothetical protein
MRRAQKEPKKLETCFGVPGSNSFGKLITKCFEDDANVEVYEELNPSILQTELSNDVKMTSDLGFEFLSVFDDEQRPASLFCHSFTFSDHLTYL